MEMAKKSLSSSDRPICSVCIANYNGSNVIAAALQSVARQDCDFPIEIIIHDDASTDDSVSFIKDNYPQVKLIASGVNVGFCVSNNRMVEASTGEHILLLNNDAELFPGALHQLYDASCRQHHAGILGLPQYNFFTGALIDRGSLFDPFLNTIPNFDLNRTEVAMVIGACLWVPRNLWNELGGFPPWFQSLGEDIYLCTLARLKGYAVSIVSDSGFLHRVGNSFGGGKVIANQLSTSKSRRRLSERNKSYVMALCYPRPFFQFLFPLHLAFLIIEGISISLIKKDGRLFTSIYLFCLRSLWRERIQLRNLRKSVQSTRKISSRRFFSVFLPIPHKLAMVWKHGLPEIK